MMRVKTSQVGDSLKSMKKQNLRGFTLFELLIVMTILAISIGAVFTFYRPNSGVTTLKALASQIATKIRDTRIAAIYSQRDQLVMVDIDKRNFIFQNGKSNIILPRDIKLTMTGASGEKYSNNQLAVRFFPNGSSTGGVITFLREKQAYEIRVNWLTGRVSTDIVSKN